MKLEHINYGKLNSKQQETYNFHKVASLLADYGFHCIKLSDDWQGADFLALHKDGDTLKVQQKGRLTICKKYLEKGLYLAFPLDDRWYLIPHDELFNIVKKIKPKFLQSKSWKDGGEYHAKRSLKMIPHLSDYALDRVTDTEKSRLDTARLQT